MLWILGFSTGTWKKFFFSLPEFRVGDLHAARHYETEKGSSGKISISSGFLDDFAAAFVNSEDCLVVHSSMGGGGEITFFMFL